MSAYMKGQCKGFIEGDRVMKHFSKLSKILAGIIAAAMIVPNIGAMPEVRAAGDVVINETNFPDPNFRAAVRAYDTSKDGKEAPDYQEKARNYRQQYAYQSQKYDWNSNYSNWTASYFPPIFN